MAGRLPFADLLDLLRADGIQVGLGDYQSLGKLLARMQTANGATLGTAIAALLARNEFEAKRIQELVQAYCAADQTAPPARPPRQLSAPHKPRAEPRKSRALLWGLLLLAVGLLILLRPQRRPDYRADMSVSPVADAQPVASKDLWEPQPTDLGVKVTGSSDAGATPPMVDAATSAPHQDLATETTSSAAECAAPSPLPPVAPPIPTIPSSLRSGRLAGILATGLALLILSHWLGRRIAARPQRARKALAQLRGPALYTLQLRDLPPALTREELDHLATFFARLRVELSASRTIDVRRSLLRRLRAQMPPLVFAGSQRRYKLILLRDLAVEMRPQARFLDTFVAGMQVRGLSIRCYFYRGSADWIAEEPDGLPIPLTDLSPHGADSIFLVFGCSTSLLIRHGLTSATWLRTLAQFPRRIWLMADLEQRARAAVLRDLAIPVFAQSYLGLRDAVRMLLRGEDRLGANRVYPAPFPVTLAGAAELQYLIQLAPYATPELAELLRQRYCHHVPERVLGTLMARSLDPTGETLVFAAASDDVIGQKAVPAGDEIRSALVRRYLLQVLDDSEPGDCGTLAHLRWRLDRALLTLQIPDPRQVLHRAAQAELVDLLKSPLFEEVRTVAAQHISEKVLPVATLPFALRRQVAAASPSWLRWSAATLLILLGPALLTATALWGLNKVGWLHRRYVIAPDTFAMRLEPEAAPSAERFAQPPSARFDPLGRSVLTLSASGTLEIWEVARLLAPAHLRSATRAGQGAFFSRDAVSKEGRVSLQPPVVLTGHRAGVNSVQFSPDGKRIVTASSDDTARVWEAGTGQLLLELKGKSAGVVNATFSPDGKRLVGVSNSGTLGARFNLDGKRIVTASSDGTARVWDAGTGQLVAELQGHTAVVLSASFSPDGRRIVTAGADSTARVWDAETGRLDLSLKSHQAAVRSAQFSPDGRTIVTASNDTRASVWEVKSGLLLMTMPNINAIVGATFRPDGRQIVTAGADNTVLLWGSNGSGSPVVLQGHTGPITSLAYSPDGRRVVSGSADQTVRLWRTDGSGILLVLKGHTGPVTSVAYSPDGRSIVSGSEDQTVRLWQADGTGGSIVFPGIGGTVTGVAYNPDGRSIVAGSGAGGARVWPVSPDRMIASASYSPDGLRLVVTDRTSTARVLLAKDQSLITELRGHTGQVLSASFSPDGSRVITASQDQTAGLWDAHSGAQLVRLAGHLDRITVASVSTNGLRILTGSADATAQIWDARSGKQLQRLYGNQDTVVLAHFSPDSRRVLTVARASRTAQIFDVESGRVMTTLMGHTGSIQSAAFSPDGRQVLTAGADGTARLWDQASGSLLTTLRPPCGAVRQVALSPDSKYVATGTSGGLVQLWSAGRLLYSLTPAHEGAVTSLQFSPDGHYLLSAGTDHVPRLHEMATGRSTAWVQSERRFVAPAESKLQLPGDLELSGDVSEFKPIGRIALAQLGQPLVLPLPTTNRSHYFRATSRGPTGDLVLSTSLLVPAVALTCLGDECPLPPGPSPLVKVVGNKLSAAIFYEEDKAVIKPDEFPVLDAVAQLLRWRRDIRQLRVEGHHDNLGIPSEIGIMTEARAQAVRTYLIDKGVELERLVAEGFGAKCPRTANDTPEQRARNRRVEFAIMAQDGVPLKPPDRCSIPVPMSEELTALAGQQKGNLIVKFVNRGTTTQIGSLTYKLIDATGKSFSGTGGEKLEVAVGTVRISMQDASYRPVEATHVIKADTTEELNVEVDTTLGGPLVPSAIAVKQAKKLYDDALAADNEKKQLNLMRDSLKVSTNNNDIPGVIRAHWKLAELDGDSKKHWDQILTLSRQIGAQPDEAWASYYLARGASSNRSAELYKNALSILNKLGNFAGISQVLDTMLEDTGISKVDSRRRLLLKLLDAQQKLNNKVRESEVLLELASLEENESNFSAERTYLERAATITGAGVYALGSFEANHGSHDRARQLIKRALAGDGTLVSEDKLAARIMLAILDSEDRCSNDTVNKLNELLTESPNARAADASIQTAMGDCLFKLGNKEKAINYWTSAKKIYTILNISIYIRQLEEKIRQASN